MFTPSELKLSEVIVVFHVPSNIATMLLGIKEFIELNKILNTKQTPSKIN